MVGPGPREPQVPARAAWDSMARLWGRILARGEMWSDGDFKDEGKTDLRSPTLEGGLRTEKPKAAAVGSRQGCRGLVERGPGPFLAPKNISHNSHLSEDANFYMKFPNLSVGSDF